MPLCGAGWAPCRDSSWPLLGGQAGGHQQGAQRELEPAAWGICVCVQGEAASGCEMGLLGQELAWFETSGVP